MSTPKKDETVGQDSAQDAAAKAVEADGAALDKVAKPEDIQLHGVAVAQHDEAPKTADEATKFMQKFGAVPTGWIFEPATGLRKA